MLVRKYAKIEELRLVYGEAFDFLPDPADRFSDRFRLLIDPGKWAIVFETVPDFLSDGFIPVLYYDYMIDYSPWLANLDSKSLTYKADATPIAVLDNTPTFEAWVEKIKTKNTYKKGDRYKRLSSKHINYSIDNALEYLDESIKRKMVTYPSFSGTELLFIDRMFSPKNWIVSITEEEDGYVAMMLSYEKDGTLFVPYLETTNDPILKQRHRCCVVGHMACGKYAYDNGLKTDFGLYMPYKDIMSLDCKYNPSVRYSNSEVEQMAIVGSGSL